MSSNHAKATEGDAFVQLRWQPAASAQSCPAQAELEQLVRLRLGRDPFTPNAPRTIEATIEHTGAAWHVELHQRGGPTQGQRVFDVQADSCAQVVDAVGLAVALAIDPNASIASLPSSAAMQSEPSPPERSQASASTVTHNGGTWLASPALTPSAYLYPPAPAPQTAPAPYKAQLTLRGLLAGGLLPGAAPGLGIAGAVGGRLLQITLGMSYLPEETLNPKFAFGLTTLDAGVCGHAPRSHWFTSSVCAEGHFGTVHSVVAGLMPLQPGDRFYSALSIGPKVGWIAWAPFFIEAGASAWVALQRPMFGLANDSSPPFYEVREVSAVGFLGVGWTTDSQN